MLKRYFMYVDDYFNIFFPEKVESTTPVNQPPLPPMDPEIRKRRSIMPHGNRYTSDEKDAKSEFVVSKYEIYLA